MDVLFVIAGVCFCPPDMSLKRVCAPLGDVSQPQNLGDNLTISDLDKQFTKDYVLQSAQFSQPNGCYF